MFFCLFFSCRVIVLLLISKRSLHIKDIKSLLCILKTFFTSFLLAFSSYGLLSQKSFNFYVSKQIDQQVWGFCWLTIDILLFAISVLAAKRQIYLFFITLNIYSAHQAYRIHFDIILCIYYNIFIHHDGHLNCLKTFTIMDNPIMDIVVHISLCTRVRVS